MAKSKLSYNQKEARELKKILGEKEKELLGATMDFSQGKIKDVHVRTKLRREIARIKTAVGIKELEAR